MCYYTVREVADLLKLPRDTVIMIIRAGDLKARKVDGRWLICDKDLQDFLSRQTWGVK